MPPKELSVVLFHDGPALILQDRRSHSKFGEKYGFWGGGLDAGETPLNAIYRELKEELGYVPESIKFWTDYSFQINDPGPFQNWFFLVHIFLSPITEKLLRSEIKEGDGFARFTVEEVLKNNNFDQNVKDIIRKFKNDILK